MSSVIIAFVGLCPSPITARVMRAYMLLNVSVDSLGYLIPFIPTMYYSVSSRIQIISGFRKQVG